MFISKYFKPQLINGVYYAVALLADENYKKDDMIEKKKPEYLTLTGTGVTIKKAKKDLFSKILETNV